MLPALALTALLVVLDDGERVARAREHALPPSPWPSDITLFAMRGETLAVQAVVEGRPPIRGIHATFASFTPSPSAPAARPLLPRVETFSERFLSITRPSGNERSRESLAATADAALPPADVTGYFADPLVPGDTDLLEGDRAALWIDLTIPPDAAPGDYESRLYVSGADGVLGERRVALRVLDRDMPWAAAKTMIYYEPKNLERRMGDRGAELELRQLFHAHHVSAIHDVTAPGDMALDDDALSGELFTVAHGYDGPGDGVGEGVFAIGAYGSLGAPSPASRAAVSAIAARLRANGRADATEAFLYAIDEDCKSPLGGLWLDALRAADATRGVRAGVTCGVDPMAQRADLVMMTAPDLDPDRARVAKRAGKWVWAYNGQRPYAGPMMLDVPAVDLRANAWIAARYDVARWFYWESTYWYDDNRGGQGGWDGFDPFETAETFHDADGDWADGDGILVYPGTQIGARGMRDFGQRALFPSVRLKNIRRGVEDAAYIAAARAVDPEAADAIVRRVVPRALARAGKRAAWPARGAAFLDARRELLAILERARADAPAASARRGCEGRGSLAALAALIALGALGAVRRARRRA